MKFNFDFDWFSQCSFNNEGNVNHRKLVKNKVLFQKILSRLILLHLYEQFLKLAIVFAINYK